MRPVFVGPVCIGEKDFLLGRLLGSGRGKLVEIEYKTVNSASLLNPLQCGSSRKAAPDLPDCRRNANPLPTPCQMPEGLEIALYLASFACACHIRDSPAQRVCHRTSFGPPIISRAHERDYHWSTKAPRDGTLRHRGRDA